jgi:hypothetical protein
MNKTFLPWDVEQRGAATAEYMALFRPLTLRILWHRPGVIRSGSDPVDIRLGARLSPVPLGSRRMASQRGLLVSVAPEVGLAVSQDGVVIE